MGTTNDKAAKIVKYIVWHWDNLGCAPTYREIGAACGIRSTSTIQTHLKNLEAKGRITIGAKGKNVRVINDGDPRFCSHDWRVRKVANPMPIQCIDCGHRTEVDFDHRMEYEISSVLKYVGVV